MLSNVSSDAVTADEDTAPTIFIHDSALIFSATRRHSNTIAIASYYWPALLLSFFSIVGVLGNLLVCLSIATERRLQNRTNWFLFSLALADMLVSGLVIPLAVVKEFTGSWILGPIICDLWIFLDVCSCTSSIMHIVVISIDRYLAIYDPLNTRTRQQKCKILLLILLIWSIAVLLSSPMIVLGAINPHNIIINGQCLINNQFFVIYGSVVSFVIPLIIVIVMYTLTVRRLKEQIRQCQRQLAQEQLARAASLVAKPFLRRNFTSRNAATVATAKTGSLQSIGLPVTTMRRMRFRQQQTSLEVSEQSADTINIEEQKQQRQFDQESQIEQNPVTSPDILRQISTNLSPHNEYTCPKNTFCQLKCTFSDHQLQQQQQESIPNSKLNLNCLRYIDCCQITAITPPSHRRLAPKSQTTPSLCSSGLNHLSTSSTRSTSASNTKKNWSRLTITPNYGSSRTKSSAVRNEQKAVKVLGVVFVIFVIAWFPFCIMNLLQGVCKRCTINSNILNGFVWLGYVSSTINPLVYTIFNRNFRLKFISLLKCHCSRKKSRRKQFLHYHHYSKAYGSHLHRKNGLVQRETRRHNPYREQHELKLLESIPQKAEIT